MSLGDGFEAAEVLQVTETGKFDTKAIKQGDEGPRDLLILKQRELENPGAAAAAEAASLARENGAGLGTHPEQTPKDRVQALMGSRGLEDDEVEFLDGVRSKALAKERAAKRAREEAEDEFDAALRERVVATAGPVAGIAVKADGNLLPPAAPGASAASISAAAAPSTMGRGLADAKRGSAKSSHFALMVARRQRPAASPSSSSSPSAAARAGPAPSCGQESEPKRPRQAAALSRAAAAIATYASSDSESD